MPPRKYHSLLVNNSYSSINVAYFICGPACEKTTINSGDIILCGMYLNGGLRKCCPCFPHCVCDMLHPVVCSRQVPDVDAGLSVQRCMSENPLKLNHTVTEVTHTSTVKISFSAVVPL